MFDVQRSMFSVLPALPFPDTSHRMRTHPLCLLLFLPVTACSVLEKGSPSASTKIAADSETDIEAAITDVFRGHGYTVLSRNSAGIVLERPGSKTDNLLYGNWNDAPPPIDRVRVTIAPGKTGIFLVSCFPSVVRGGGDLQFQDSQRRLQPFSFHYGALLREVRSVLK